MSAIPVAVFVVLAVALVLVVTMLSRRDGARRRVTADGGSVGWMGGDSSNDCGSDGGGGCGDGGGGGGSD